MQCKLLIALALSFLTFAVSAAPIPESSILDREIEHAPFVGMSEVAREPEPEPETETEEARACRMYACIWYVHQLHPSRTAVLIPHRTPPTTCIMPCPALPSSRPYYVALRCHARLKYPGPSIPPLNPPVRVCISAVSRLGSFLYLYPAVSSYP
ncbi:hypothetical protein B0H19DRAFT_1249039 [Mycena capillaripes]|nr:hypothetical protein B0H19DRAFT_1249039 [Mycena capillaripes]